MNDLHHLRTRGRSSVETKIHSLKQGDYAEATLQNKTEPGPLIKCHFRPTQYTYAKANTWEAAREVGKHFNTPQFKGGAPVTLTLSNLLFDVNEDPSDTADVRDITGKVWDLMKVAKKRKHQNTEKSEPPWVEFRWGQVWSFTAVITEIKETFILFSPSGRPLRSKMDITFMQALETEQFFRQNPTSGAEQGYDVHIVKEGETIDWIAFEAYGNANAWRHLATVNNLDDPSRLQPGQRLLLVPLV